MCSLFATYPKSAGHPCASGSPLNYPKSITRVETHKYVILFRFRRIWSRIDPTQRYASTFIGHCHIDMMLLIPAISSGSSHSALFSCARIAFPAWQRISRRGTHALSRVVRREKKGTAICHSETGHHFRSCMTHPSQTRLYPPGTARLIRRFYCGLI